MPAIRPALTIHLRVTFVVVLTVGFTAQRFRKNEEGGCKKYKNGKAHNLTIDK
jgi:hypothetical protein